MKKTLLLVDGNGLLYRAYHAFPKDLTSPSGEYMGAVYGFTRILLTTLKSVKPTSVAVMFDLKGPTFRDELYDAYKGTREKMPEDLASQIKRTHQIVEFLEVPIYAKEGFEADDMIGTVARLAVENDDDTTVIILTGDQDILQLVNDRIHVLTPGNSTKPAVIYTPETFKEKYGFEPIQMIEYKALRGDASDNIPGVPGIGEVGAKKLLAEFPTIDKLYEELHAGRAESVKGSTREKLIAGEDSARLSHKLATIVTDAPADYAAADCVMELKAPDRLIDLFNELGFKSLLRDLPASHRLISEATDVFSEAAEEKAEEAAVKEPEDNESLRMDAKLAPVLRAMEQRGITVDCAYLKELEGEFAENIEKIKKDMFDLAGEEFNTDSPTQIGHILYEVLHIPTKGIKKTKTGFTTDAGTLNELAKEYPIAALILQYRELAKLLSTYVKPLQEITDEKSRVHTSYAPDTATGRISSRDPNLQNIPIKTEQGRRIRKAFVAEKGWRLVSADYSQIELRIAANMSGDKAMQEAFIKGGDFHAETAERMGVDRRIAKIINFSILYGKGAYTLAWDLGVTVPEAKQYLEDYYKTFATLRAFLDKTLADAKKNGYTETMFGRRRYYPEINSPHFVPRAAAEREAVNAPIQGSGADILKKAMLDLDAALEKSKLKARMILTVHDELVLEAPEAEVPEVAKLLKEVMEAAVTMTVPLLVSVKQGKNWEETEPVA